MIMAHTKLCLSINLSRPGTLLKRKSTSLHHPSPWLNPSGIWTSPKSQSRPQRRKPLHDMSRRIQHQHLQPQRHPCRVSGPITLPPYFGKRMYQDMAQGTQYLPFCRREFFPPQPQARQRKRHWVRPSREKMEQHRRQYMEFRLASEQPIMSSEMPGLDFSHYRKLGLQDREASPVGRTCYWENWFALELLMSRLVVG